jgi:CheY-like chemotaxis protein
VTALPDGVAALDHLRHGGGGGDPGARFDILVTDLAMPGMDGISLIREAQRSRPGLPAILVTGFAGDAAALAMGSDAGAVFALLRKPVSGTELADQIAALLAPPVARERIASGRLQAAAQ